MRGQQQRRGSKTQQQKGRGRTAEREQSGRFRGGNNGRNETRRRGAGTQRGDGPRDDMRGKNPREGYGRGAYGRSQRHVVLGLAAAAAVLLSLLAF